MQYAQAWKWKDFAWWYNERSYVGLLAAAAWQVGGHSLEEYSTRKRYSSGKYAGRGDLYFRLAQTDYIAEAKHDWVRLGRRSPKLPGRLRDFLRLARKSVVDAETKRATKLGMLFIAPMIPWNQSRHAAALLNSLVGRVRSEVPYDAAAWVFPKQAKLKHDDGYVYPGVGLLILKD
jgi:hypothetical protein